MHENAHRFNRVSPKLVWVSYLNELPWVLLLALGCAVATRWSQWFWIGVAFFAAVFFWELVMTPLRVRRLGWKESDEELLITKGKFFHTFTVIPYGRIQFVDVTAGPVARAFGLKTVELHTASASSDSTVPGLPAAEADALRERLSINARERMIGL